MSLVVMAINGGSSSLKFALFEQVDRLRRILSGEIEGIGLRTTTLHMTEAGGSKDEPITAADIEEAGRALLGWLEHRVDLSSLDAFGHRVVYGGPRHTRAEPITPAVLEELERGGVLDPDHVPGELAVAELFLRRFPRTVHVACFDTAFHRDMPRVAQLFAIPRRYYEEEGIRRYGFHGLSYAFLVGELARLAGPEAAHGRLVLAHLGAGSSMAAVRNATCVDTTMALTPVGGLVMGTRSGDLDPGLLIHLLNCGLSVGQLNDLVNQRSGLLGVSGTTSDMKTLLERERTDASAAEAVELYCQQAAKYAAAMAVAAGGLDTLVFSAGIGERSPPIRARICEKLTPLGVRIDEDKNAAGAPIISTSGSPTTVRVIKTDEEMTIAQETLRVLASTSKVRA